MAGDPPFPYALTEHAREVIAERRIPLRWLIQTIENPEIVHPDLEDAALRHALARVPEFRDRVLRVIYNPGEQSWRIVTVYFFDRSMKGKI